MIIGVAIKQNGIVFKLPKPNRHHNVIRYMVEEMGLPKPIKGEQGFYNENGVFINREQALLHVLVNGQISKSQHSIELFSEDLW